MSNDFEVQPIAEAVIQLADSLTKIAEHFIVPKTPEKPPVATDADAGHIFELIVRTLRGHKSVVGDTHCYCGEPLLDKDRHQAIMLTQVIMQMGLVHRG